MKITGFPQVQKTLADLGLNVVKFGGRALYREAEQIMTLSKQYFAPSDRGTLKASGHVVPPVVQNGKLVVTLAYGGAASGYAVYVHEGTGPAVGRPTFFPPLEAIKEWAKRHGIPEEAAYPIARAIGERGLSPLKYLEKPLLESARNMDERLAASVRLDVEKIAKRQANRGASR